MSLIKKISAVLLTSAPVVALAQLPAPLQGPTQGISVVPATPNGHNLASFVALILGYANWALALLMGFAVVVFVYYVIKYFILPNEDRKQAGMYVLYSVIGFFVILSFWGLVYLVQNTFNLGTGGGLNNLNNILPF